MKLRRAYWPSLAFRLLELAFALVFLTMVVHHVIAYDFRPLLAFCAPILVVYYGFASLLFVRGRSLPAGPAQTRSLFGAERAVQATLWHMLGIIVGVALYGCLWYAGFAFDQSDPSLAGLWLLLFLLPYALMQIGLLCFMSAIWTITPQFFRRVGTLEMGRRVHQG